MKRAPTLFLLLALFLSPAAWAAPKAPAGPPPRPSMGAVSPWRAPAPEVKDTAAGVRVMVLPRHDVPLVHIEIDVRAGAELDPIGAPGLAAAVASMLMDGGAGSRDAPELAAAFDELGDELRIQCERDGVRLTLTVMARHLESALTLLGDLLVRPRFDAAEWTRARARRVAEIVRLRDDARAIADAVFDRALYGDAHPYGARLLGSEAAVSALSVADLKKFYALHYGPKTTTVMLAGDVTLDRARALVDKSLAGWSSPAVPASPPRAESSRVPRVVLVDRPGAPQSEVRVGHVGIARDSADFPSAMMIGSVLGGSFTSRLVQNLREKHGYTYGVRAQFRGLRAPGPFVVSTAIRTDVTAPALQEIVKELRAIRDPLAEVEAGKARALLENRVVESYGDGTETLRLLSEAILHDLDADTWTHLPDALAHLKVPDLQSAAARLIDADKLTIVIVGDRKTVEPTLRALPFVHPIEIRDVDGKQIPQ